MKCRCEDCKKFVKIGEIYCEHCKAFNDVSKLNETLSKQLLMKNKEHKRIVIISSITIILLIAYSIYKSSIS